MPVVDDIQAFLARVRTAATGPGPVKPSSDTPIMFELEPRVLYDASPLGVLLQPVEPTAVETVDLNAIDLEEIGPVDAGFEYEATDFASVEGYAEFGVSGDDGLGVIPAESASQLVVIDAAVEDYEQLIESLAADATVLVLDGSQNGVAQISAALRDSGRTFDAVHIVSHGRDGGVQLGNQLLHQDSLQSVAAELSQWTHFLSSDADVLFYGCDLAGSESGEEFIDSIAALTGADVAASDDLTGHADLGGDWILEYAAGAIGTDVIFTADLQDNWYHTLDITSNLILHNTFDVDASDSSSNSYDGTLTNGASIDTTTGTNQVGDGKLSLDGVDDYVDVSAHVANFDNLTEGTISAWVYADALTGQEVIFEGADSSDFDSRYSLVREGDEFGVYVNEGTTELLVGQTTSLNISTNTWYHVTFAVNATGNTLYVDGQQQTLTYTAGSASSNFFFDDVTEMDFLAWGTDKFDSTSYFHWFDGFIDDGRVYDRALSASDVAELYAYTGGINVDTTNDTVDGTTTDVASLLANKGTDGFISLREAIQAINNDAATDWTINLGAGTFSLDETGAFNASALTGDFDISKDITIVGAGTGQTIIDGSALGDRVFDVFATGDLTLSDLTIADASTGSIDGAAVNVQTGATLTATDVVFSNNDSTNRGGAIFTEGTTTLDRVAIFDSDGQNGGAIAIFGGTTSLTNSTISGNTAQFDGAGIFVSSGTITIDHSTIANNQTTGGGNGGGIRRNSGTVNISNSIVADNTTASSGSDVSGDIVSGGYNIIEDATGFTGSVGTDTTGSDPGLSALALVDGTYVHTIDTTSIAHDAATGSAETTDQLGTDRDANPDIGAYEFVLSDLIVDTFSDTIDGATSDVAALLANRGTDGFISLREAILAVNNDASNDWTINLGAGTYLLSAGGSNDSSGDLDIRNNVVIVGAGQGSTIIDTNRTDRLIQLHAGELVLQDLTLQGGRGSNAGAALNVATGATATLDSVRVTDNWTEANGGAIFTDGTLTIVDSQIDNNRSTDGTGGAIRSTGSLTIARTTFDSNTNDNASNGGAIFLEASGVTTIDDSLFVGNVSGNDGGAIQAQGTVIVTNSTFSQNSAEERGSAINVASGTTTLQNVTVTGNTDANNGAIQVNASATLNIGNTIIAGNTGPSQVDLSLAGTAIVNDLGNNLIGDTTGQSALVDGVNGNQVGTSGTPIDPLLGALADNGGPTLTHALLVGSTAIDAGNNTGTPALDQRGNARDVSTDIGAYEYVAPILVTNTNDSGAGSLRQAIIDANANLGADRIEFDITGSGTQIITVSSPLDAITDQVIIDGTTQSGWVEGSFLPIVIDGNDGAFDGLTLSSSADGSTIRGLVVRDFGQDGIQIDVGSDNNTIAGNWVGRFASDGTFVTNEGLGESSIEVLSSGNVIGGTTAADRNVIEDAAWTGGVRLEGTSALNNTIAGNYFGTTIDGNTANDEWGGYGVLIIDGASNNTVGGATAAHRNVFGNLYNGVLIDTFSSGTPEGNVIQSNYFGLSADGSTAFELNAEAGVTIYSGDNNVIGGVGVGNTFVSADSGYSSWGLRILGNSTIIQGNYIGTDSTGTINAGFDDSGIIVQAGGDNTQIGGINPGEGNVIANNDGPGVWIDDPTGVSIRGNSIYSNAGLGIDFDNDGQNANDAGDADTGSNNLQNSAVLKEVSITDSGQLTAVIDRSELADAVFTIDFYASSDRDGGQVEGKRYLGSQSFTGGRVNDLSTSIFGVTLTPGEYVTSTVTDFSGNTSEFSNYAVAVDGDAGGTTPTDLNVTATAEGGLSINQDGGNDVYLEANDGGAILGGLTSFTVEIQAAFEPLSDGSDTLLQYRSDDGTDELRLTRVDISNQLWLRINGVNVVVDGYDFSQIEDGAVHALAVTWDSATGNWEVFVDGTSVDSGTNFQTGHTLDSSGSLILGQQRSVNGRFDVNRPWGAELHDVRIFGDVRTDIEIASNYRSTLPYDEDGLLANWQFDDLSSDGVTTDSVFGNNLTVRHSTNASHTVSEASLTFAIDENAIDGTVIGSVGGIDAEREAQIASLLAADPDLRYSAETGKFYQYVDTAKVYVTAAADAQTTLLEGITGNLVSIRSALENQFVVDLVNSYGNSTVYIGGSDSTVEGEWRWQESGNDQDQFWQGMGFDGYNTNGAYTNWEGANPNDAGGGQDFIALSSSTGLWDDTNGTNSQRSIIEWNADDVLDAAQALTYTINAQTVAGAFAIDASTGKITVADGSLLDYETNATHTLTVRVSDGVNTYDEAFTVSLSDLAESNNAPTDLSSGIELNTDGGNDAYLISNSGLSQSLAATTFEIQFAANDTPTETVFMSFNNAAGDEYSIQLDSVDGRLELDFGGGALEFSDAIDYAQVLLDGELHSLAVSWDNTNGDWAVYVDGQFVDSGTGLNTGAALDTTNGQFVFGQEQDGLDTGYAPDQIFSGTIYGIRIWNEVRSEAEISLNHQNKFDSGSMPSGLVANWQMELNGSNEVVDIVSANNLSIGNATNPPPTDINGWTNGSGGVTASGNTITYVDDGQPDGWNSQINSPNVSTLGFSDNYTISFTLDNTTNFSWTVGLSATETDADLTDVEHAIYVDHLTGVAEVRNNGVSAGLPTVAYSAGGEFGFVVNGTTLEYQYDGVTFASETIAAGTDWYIDTSFFNRTIDGTYNNQDTYSLSNFQITSNEFIASTPVDDLHISENATNGTTVGFVVPSDPDVSNDVVSDGLFLEAPDPGSFQTYNTGQAFGDWTVRSGSVDLIDTFSENSPLGGRTVDLNGSTAGGIYQTLDTEAGRQYQVVFQVSGSWSGGDEVRDLRISGGGESQDFSIAQPDGWSSTNMLFAPRSFTFTADGSTTDLDFISLDTSGGTVGPIIGDVQVIEIPAAVTTILNNDPTLDYDAATGKFYRNVQDFVAFDVARSAATAAQLNGVSGQLVTIRSAYENELVRNISTTTFGTWLGGTDEAVEGDFRWLDGSQPGELFWQGGVGGSPTAGNYANFDVNNPDNLGEADYVYINKSTGQWDDLPNGSGQTYIIEWDASEVLSNFTFSLTDDAGGRFAIDSNTGEVTVADGSLIDFENATSHNVTIEVTDAAGNSYNEVMAISVDNELDANQTVPGAQTVNEDSVLTFNSANGNAVTVSDSIAGTNSPLQVSLSVANGVLNLSTTTGLTFVSGTNGSGSFVVNGTESDINTALDGMTFTPDANFNGGVSLDMTTALAADLEGHYTFEGASADDQAAGVAQNGTFGGDASTTIDPIRGEVLSVDGAGDYVNIASTFAPLTDVTIGAWVRFSSTNSNGGDVINIGNTIILRVDRPTFGTTAAFWDGSTSHNIDSGVFLGDGQWHHVAYSIDSAADRQVLYIDGVAVGETNATTSIGTSHSNTRIGGHVSSAFPSRDFNGLIDDARVYTRALSADEISALVGDQTTTSDNVQITVNAVNDAPVLDDTASPILDPIVEDAGAPVGAVGTLVSSLVDFASPAGQLDNVSDVDSGAVTGIAVTAANTTNGTLWYSTDNGANWNALGSVSDSSARLLAADATTRIYFQAAADFNGTVSDAITFKAWDQSSGSNGGTANTSAADTYRDEFNAQSYSNNDGSANWAGDWIETGDPGGPSSGAITVVLDQLQINPFFAGRSIHREVDLSGATSATLSFDYRNNTSATAVELQISNDGGSTFTALQTFDDSTLTGTGAFTVDISAHLAANTQIRFETFIGGAGGALNVDNIQIEAVTGTAPTAFSTDTDTAAIMVTAVNDTPVITGGPDTSALTETNAGLTDSGTLTISDVDTTDTVTAAVESVAVTGTGVATVPPALTNAAIRNFLTVSPTAILDNTETTDTLTWNFNSGSEAFDFLANGETLVLEYTISATDDNGSPLSDTEAVTVTITGTNDAPVQSTIEPTPVAYTENDGPTVITSTLAIADVDDTNIESATVQITGNYVNGEDVLAFTTQNGISASFNATTGELALTGTATVAEYEAALQSITYQNNSDTPSEATRTVTFTVNDGDANSNTQTRDINVTAVNDAAIITQFDGTPSFTEGDGPVAIDTDVLIDDIGEDDLTTFNVVVTGVLDGGSEQLTIGGQAIGLGTNASFANVVVGSTTFNINYTASTGLLTATQNGGGIVDTADLQTLARSLTYQNTDQAPTSGQRALTMSVTDDGGQVSNAAKSVVSVTSVADAILAADDNITAVEDVAFNGTYTATDADADNVTFALGTDAANGTVIVNANGDYTYTGDTNFNGSDSFTIDVTSRNTQRIAGLFTTGVADDWTLLANAADDPHYDLTFPTAGGFTDNVFTNIPVPYVDADANSQWITSNAPNEGTYQLQTTFNISANADLSSILLNLDLAVDNDLTDMLINGQSTGVTHTGLNATTNINLDASTFAHYQTGANTLTFVLSDSGGQYGLLIDEIVASETLIETTTATVNVTVDAVNDAPVNTVPGAQSVNEDTSVAIGGISVADSDDNLSTVQLSVANGTLNVTVSGAASISAGANDSNDLTLSGSLADINATLASLSYQGVSNFNGTDTLTVLSTDSDSATDSDTITINVGAVNDDPANAGSLPGDVIVTEDVSSNVDLSLVDLSDVDAAGSDLTVTLTTSTGGNLSAANGAGITIGGSSTALTLTGSQVDLNTYLNTTSNVTYLHTTANLNGNDADTINVVVNDLGNTGTGGGTDQDFGTVNVDITAVNDEQTIVNNNTLTVAESSTNNLLGNAQLRTTDVDNTSDQLIYTLTGDVANGQLLLNGIELNINDTFTQEDVDLGRVRYSHDGSQTASDSFNFSVDDGEGTATTATFNIAITNVNDAPVVADLETAAINYTENAGQISVTDTVTLADADDTDLTHAAVKFTAGYVQGEDFLHFVDQNGIVGTFDSVTGALSLDGIATVTQYQTALRSVTYSNISDNPDTTTRTFVVLAEDATLASNEQTRDIVITATNDDPTNAGTLPGDVAITEDILSNVDLSAIDFSDVDANGSDLTVTLSTSTGGELTLAADGDLTFGGTATARTITGTLAELNAYFDNAASVQYLHATADTFGNDADTITVVINDNGNTGTGGGAGQTLGVVNVDITAVNDEEVLATNAGATVAEGSTGNTITTADLQTTDVDNTASQLVYTVNSATANGTLRLSGTPLGVNGTFTQADIDNNLVAYDHDGSQTSSDSFDFTVDDGTGTTTSATFNFTVGNVNDAPVNTVPGVQTVDEDTSVAITGISVADADDNLSTVQLSVGNGVLNVTLSGAASLATGANGSAALTLSGSLVDINATLASLSYQGNLNFNGTDTLTVLSTDTDSATDSDTVTINVGAVNDDPTNAGSLPGDVTVTEDVSSNVDLSAIDLSDVDAAGSDLTVTLTTSTGGNLSAAAGAGIAIGGSSTALTLTGSQADLNTYLNTTSNVTYLHATANLNGNDADTITVIVNDLGNTGTGGGTDQNLGTVNVDITAVNDEEVLATNMGTTVAEGSAGTTITTAMLETTDVDNTDVQLVYTVDTATANGTLRLSGTSLGVNDTFTQADIDAGNVTYDHDGSQTSSDSFDFTVDDGAGTATSASFSLTVTNVNDAPVNTVPGAQTIDEDNSVAVTGVSVFDADDNLSTVQLTVDNGTLNVTLSGAASISAGANDSADLTLSGSLADINSTLASLTYQGNSEFSGSDTLTILSTDTDAAADVDTVAIGVTAVNDDPFNAGTLPSDVVVTEDVSSSVDLSPIDLSDVDAGSSDLTVTLTTATGGNLTAVAGAGISIGGSSTSLTLTGSLADLNNYLNTASNVSYLHGTADLNGDDADTINVAVNDLGNTGSGGGADQNLGTVNVDIAAVNDAPVNTVPGTQTVDEETTTAIAGISIGDVDAAVGNVTTQLQVTMGSLNVTLSGGASISAGNNGTANLTIQGTAADVNATLASLLYTGDVDVYGTAADTLTVTTNDAGNTGSGVALQDVDTVQIDITNVNDAPTVTLANVVSSIDENSDTSSRVKIADIVISDDGIGTNDLSLSGTDAVLFEIVGSELFVRAGATLDFEADSSLDVTIEVDDLGVGADPDDTVMHTLNVNDRNDAPVMPGDTSAFVAENTTNVGVFAGTDDDAGDVLTYSLSGVDAGLFNIDSSTGAVTFVSAPNFEAPSDSDGDNVYDIVVVATDDGTGALSDSQNVSVNVTDTNEDPEFEALQEPRVRFGGVVTLEPAYANASDPDQTAAEIDYVLRSLPIYGTLQLDGITLAVGASFTQADVNASRVTYVHSASSLQDDVVTFDILDGEGGALDAQALRFEVEAVAGGTHEENNGSDDSDPDSDTENESPDSGDSGEAEDASDDDTEQVTDAIVAPQSVATNQSLQDFMNRIREEEKASGEKLIGAEIMREVVDQRRTQQILTAMGSTAGGRAGTDSNVRADEEEQRVARGDFLFWDQLEEYTQEVDYGLDIEMTVGTITVLGTFGGILWALRGGALVAVAFANLPGWSFVDPLPILENYRERKEQSDDEEDVAGFF